MTDQAPSRQVFVIGPDAGNRRQLSAFLADSNIAAVNCTDGSQLLGEIERAKNGCVIVDISSLHLDGLEALSEVRAARPDIPVLLMTGCRRTASALAFLQSNNVEFVEGFGNDPEDFLQSVRQALATSAEALSGSDILGQAKKRDVLGQLSPRERDVLALLVEGKQNKAVAHDLGISPRTVEVHRSRLMRRLNVTSFAELIRLALEAGLGKSA